ncbi:hypothetical protein LTR08_007553 [Meristemomyces frigidus]|nr:hypothetical protein LTR08_007553 [Meristemomyces frigidus]
MSREVDDKNKTAIPTYTSRHPTVDDMPPLTAIPTSTLNASPFLLKVHDVETLTQSDGFTILRGHLAEQYTYELCDAHTPAYLEDLNRWLIVRDLLHALLVPVVELFDKACLVASQATNASKLEDLEYAFTGHARSAFVWLQCFLASEKEREWCYSRGCPACVVNHSLDSEFTIRLLYAACLLSDVHYPFTLEGPTLPSFMFFLESLESAVEQDPLWSDAEDFYEKVQPKAIVTRNGIEDLILQCLELDTILSQPPSSSPSAASSPTTSLPGTPVLAALGGTTPMTKVKRSKMARRQMKLQVEEELWMKEMMLKCCDQLAGQTICPTQSLDAVLKAEPTVAVEELPLGD